MKSAGMNVIMPYTHGGDPKPYLDRAHKAGMKVFVEIDRGLLILPIPSLVAMWVQNFKDHPAVYGWLLMDEPTIDPDYAFMSPSSANSVYQAIKSVDQKHPVGIVFGVKENPRPWLGAMDVLLFDDYVASVKVPELWGLNYWRNRLHDRAKIASGLKGYFPVLQAFGPDSSGRPQEEKRLPTIRELRYQVYTAVQQDFVTGLMFFMRQKSRKSWVDKVLTPISKEISPALRAIARGTIGGTSTTEKRVTSAMFRDPKTNALYLVAVHHGGGSRKVDIKIDPKFGMTRARSGRSTWYLNSGRFFTDTLPAYGAKLYSLGR